MGISKRELGAWAAARTGFTRLLECIPQRPSLLVLNYHRIGDPARTPYDPGTFSTTAEGFDAQLNFLKNLFEFTDLENAIAFARGQSRLRGMALLVTFDDGYLDNYTTAFPILRSHGIPAAFFLPTDFIETGRLPWTDAIAYTVKHSRNRQIRLHYPKPAVFDLDHDDRSAAIRRILFQFTQPATREPERFLSLLEEACGVSAPTRDCDQSFMSWQQAREMESGGMAFGSHTHSHPILARLPEQQQYEELARSREILDRRLQRPVSVLAYPNGARHTFSGATAAAARKAGYRAAFSFYGGLNLPGKTDPFDIRRHAVAGQSVDRLRLQAVIRARAGKCWF